MGNGGGGGGCLSKINLMGQILILKGQTLSNITDLSVLWIYLWTNWTFLHFDDYAHGSAYRYRCTYKFSQYISDFEFTNWYGCILHIHFQCSTNPIWTTIHNETDSVKNVEIIITLLSGTNSPMLEHVKILNYFKPAKYHNSVTGTKAHMIDEEILADKPAIMSQQKNRLMSHSKSWNIWQVLCKKKNQFSGKRSSQLPSSK